MPIPPPAPAWTSRPFLLVDAAAGGLSRRQLQGKRFRQLYRGVYVAAAVPDSLGLRCDGALLVLPKQVAFSHHTAALLRRLPVPDPGVIHAKVPPGTKLRIDGIAIHEGLCAEQSGKVRTVDGRPVESLETTYLDLAAVLGVEDLVVFADAALFRAWTSLADLEATVRSAPPRRRGLRAARAALPLLEPRAESPMETRLRLIIVFAGLPRPVANEDIRDEYGQWLGRPDLQYPAQRIAIQYEGGHHRLDQRQYEQDILRDEVLSDRGWVVLEFTAVDVFRRPALVVERIHYHLTVRGAI